jgi:hypothetical protein
MIFNRFLEIMMTALRLHVAVPKDSKFGSIICLCSEVHKEVSFVALFY